MRITKDYVFSVIERLGRAVAQKADEVAPPAQPGQKRPTAVSCAQKAISDELWRIQKKVAYGDIRPTDAMSDLNRLCEHHALLVSEEWQLLLRSIAV